MSGRLHPFLYIGVRDKLQEFCTFLDIPQEDKSYSHLLKEGAGVAYDLFKAGKLTEAQLAVLKDVQDPTQKLERKVTVNVNEGTIKRMDALGDQLGISEHDNYSAHIMQKGFEIVYDQWKAGDLDEKRVKELKNVFTPRGVYHT